MTRGGGQGSCRAPTLLMWKQERASPLLKHPTWAEGAGLQEFLACGQAVVPWASPGTSCRFLFRDPTGKCTQPSGASSLGKPFIPKNTHLAALRSRRQLYTVNLYPRRDTLGTPTTHGAFFLLISPILLTWMLRQMSKAPGGQWFSKVGFRVTWRAR